MGVVLAIVIGNHHISYHHGRIVMFWIPLQLGVLKPPKEMIAVLAGDNLCCEAYCVLYTTTEVLVAKDEDTNLTKEMKKRMKVDLELHYSDQILIDCYRLLHF